MPGNGAANNADPAPVKPPAEQAGGALPEPVAPPPVSPAPRRCRCLKITCCVIFVTVVLAALGLTYVFGPHIYGIPPLYSEYVGCVRDPLHAEYSAETEQTILKAWHKMRMKNIYEGQPLDIARRSQHARGLACVKASFHVLPGIPEELRHGVFAKPREYKSWVRFSPGQALMEPDTETNARGFAIKLSGVEGDKLLESEKTTQDFVLLNAPIFFTGSFRGVLDVIPYVDTPAGLITALKWKTLGLMAIVAKYWSYADNPLNHEFFSTTPYMLGKDLAVKYKVSPCSKNPETFQPGTSQMRAAIKATLDNHDVCFDFFVQKREDACAQPIEDITIPWRSEYVHVARITIPKQNFMYEDQFDFCEALSYNSWHSLPEHQPLGAINHVRRMVYQHGYKYRQEINNLTYIEPTGEETFNKEIHDINWDFSALNPSAGDIKHYRYLRYEHPDLNLSAIPAYSDGVPHGEEFSSEAFVAIILRMFMGEHSNHKHHHLLDTLVSSLSELLAKKGYQNRIAEMQALSHPQTEAEKADEKDKDHLPAAVKEGVQAVLGLFGKLLPQELHFQTLMDMLTFIIQVFSDADVSTFKDPQDYQKLLWKSATETDFPWLAKRGLWRRDDVFASQFIRGINPTSITRAQKTLPAGFKIDSEITKKINEVILRLRPAAKDTLESLLAKGQLFYIEYSCFKGLNRVPGTYLEEPIVLFVVSEGERKLMPVAIQMMSDGRTFYPPSNVNCDEEENFGAKECIAWLFVKTHVNSADANLHQPAIHLGLTHLFVEPFVIAAHREFAPTHPIYKAIFPFFHGTIGINNEGRRALMSQNGVLQRVSSLGIKGCIQIVNHAFQSVNFTEWTFPKLMKARGFDDIPDAKRVVTDDDILPGYLYRDFGYDLWNALRKYFGGVVDKIYPDEALMKVDKQLQAFAFESNSRHFGAFTTFPKTLTSKDSLADALTIIAFTASVQHSAVNFGQFDAYGFVPNRPLALTKPIPQNLDDITLSYLVSALPNADRSFAQMAVTFALSTPPEEMGASLPLSQASAHSNVLSPAPEAFSALVERLKVLEPKFVSVTHTHKWDYYSYVNPRNLSVSIAM